MTVDVFTSPQLAKTQGNVFATDAILATLMCCTRSVNSWDIIVQRVGNKLFFDKRDNSDFGESPLVYQHCFPSRHFESIVSRNLWFELEFISLRESFFVHMRF